MSRASNPYVKLASQAVHHYLIKGNILPCPKVLPDDLMIKTGVFVSIKIKNKLRGCIGSITPQFNYLAKEIIQNAIGAATRDPRFPPITKNELPDLNFSVDVLTQPKKIKSKEELDCHRFGVIVRCSEKQGVLLPNLAGIESVEEQIRICMKKAEIKSNDSIEIFRFESKRFF